MEDFQRWGCCCRLGPKATDGSMQHNSFNSLHKLSANIKEAHEAMSKPAYVRCFALLQAPNIRTKTNNSWRFCICNKKKVCRCTPLEQMLWFETMSLFSLSNSECHCSAKTIHYSSSLIFLENLYMHNKNKSLFECVCARWSIANCQCLERTSLHRTAIPLHHLPTPHHTHPHIHIKLNEDRRRKTQLHLLSIPLSPSLQLRQWTKTQRWYGTCQS